LVGSPTPAATPRPVTKAPGGADVLNAVRKHLDDGVTMAALLGVWLAATISCSRDQAQRLTAGHLNTGVAVAAGTVAVFWVGCWLRYTRYGIGHRAGTAAMGVVLAGWLLAGLSAGRDPLAVVVEVGCCALATLVLLTALRERLFGVRGVHALYRFRPTFTGGGRPLYIGITNCTAARFAQHADSKAWWPEVKLIEVEYYPTRAALEKAEIAAIHREKPIYNIAHAGRRRR
jgi:hypothetical protein